MIERVSLFLTTMRFMYDLRGNAKEEGFCECRRMRELSLRGLERCKRVRPVSG